MNAKLFWRKTNRGLWLGGALLLILTIFIIVTEVRFGLEKKKIQTTAQNLVTDLLNVNVVSGARGADGYLTETQKQAQKGALDAVLQANRYTGKIQLESESIDLAELEVTLQEWQNKVAGKINSIEVLEKDWDVSVRRNGANRVVVTVQVSAVNVQGEGEWAGVVFPYALGGSSVTDTGEWQNTCSLYCSLEMVRHGGKWQTAGISYSYIGGLFY